jgi:hydroxymethylbilane synthase
MEVELVFVDTDGDRRTDVPIHQMGGQGVFVKEVQRAVLDGRADLAVHSAKDLPSARHDGLRIGAYVSRRSPNDALVGARLDELAEGATVATGSVRRRAQLSSLRPDLVFAELRGNIHTRLDRIPDGGAIVMAVAALEILDMTERIAEVMDIDDMVPMVGQGCVAVEAREDGEALAMLAVIDHAPTRRAVEAERAFLARLGAGCQAPVAAHLGSDGVFRAFMAEGSRAVQIAGDAGHDDEVTSLGAALADECRRRLSTRS